MRLKIRVLPSHLICSVRLKRELYQEWSFQKKDKFGLKMLTHTESHHLPTLFHCISVALCLDAQARSTSGIKKEVRNKEWTRKFSFFLRRTEIIHFVSPKLFYARHIIFPCNGFFIESKLRCKSLKGKRKKKKNIGRENRELDKNTKFRKTGKSGERSLNRYAK